MSLNKAPGVVRVRVGQRWASMDWRDEIKNKRQSLEVVDVTPDYCHLLNLATGKTTRISLQRMKPGSTGYRLVADSL